MGHANTEFKFWYAISLGLQLGFIIAVPIGGFIFLGYLADKHFYTHPFFVLSGVIVGLTVTGYEVYQWLIPLIKDNDE